MIREKAIKGIRNFLIGSTSFLGFKKGGGTLIGFPLLT
jgi:hypothetical protein